jgi:hypothetical protein
MTTMSEMDDKLILGGVDGDADDAGDVDYEYDGDGVLGVVGGVVYAVDGFQGGKTGLGGDGCHCPYDSEGLWPRRGWQWVVALAVELDELCARITLLVVVKGILPARSGTARNT